MKPEFAVRQHADRLAALSDVGHQHGVGVVIGAVVHAGRAAVILRLDARLSPAQLAEIAHEGALLPGVQRLAAEQEHAMIEPGLAKDVKVSGIDGSRNVEALNLCADMGGQGMNADRHDCSRGRFLFVAGAV